MQESFNRPKAGPTFSAITVIVLSTIIWLLLRSPLASEGSIVKRKITASMTSPHASHPCTSPSESSIKRMKFALVLSCFAASKDCLRHSAINSLRFVSGTQICIGRSPAFLRASRCLLTRSVLVRILTSNSLHVTCVAYSEYPNAPSMQLTANCRLPNLSCQLLS